MTHECYADASLRLFCVIAENVTNAVFQVFGLA